MNLYKFIINPISKRKVLIKGKIGLLVLNNYLNNIKGGSNKGVPKKKQKTNTTHTEELCSTCLARIIDEIVSSASVVASLPSYEISPDSTRIRFNAIKAFSMDTKVTEGRNYSSEARAGIYKGSVIVFEGRHRTIGAAKGNTIPEELGGIPDKPGWLEFEYVGLIPDDKGYYIKPIKDQLEDIDYNDPDCETLEECDKKFNEQFKFSS